jgi:hypothetical protein
MGRIEDEFRDSVGIGFGARASPHRHARGVVLHGAARPGIDGRPAGPGRARSQRFAVG